MDFLIRNRNNSYNLVNIRSGAKVSYSSLKYTVPTLLKRKLIKIEKKVGKSKLYKINMQHRINEAILFATEMLSKKMNTQQGTKTLGINHSSLQDELLKDKNSNWEKASARAKKDLKKARKGGRKK